MVERRVYKRYSMPMSVKANYYDKGKSKSENMRLINISRGGACLDFLKPIAKGSILNLEISDCDSGFVNQLGAWNKVHGDLVNLRVQAEVKRNEEMHEQFQNHHVAVEFSSPIKIIGY